ncbi:hypothetical protein QQ045_013960 [Rhodiola kirilowii]
MKRIQPFAIFVLVVLYSSSYAKANQIDSLNRLLKAKRFQTGGIRVDGSSKVDAGYESFSPVYVGIHDGLMQHDKIEALPGQPEGVDFNQYAGHVTVDPKAGRALFYYFAESPRNSSINPLLLWLNGGPGCSSLGYGAMEELGPFRVNSDRKTLFRNPYAWNNVANVIFLESPAGVGFSYSNTSSDIPQIGDKMTADDSYTFLINWLERFPQYKNRTFYIAGESYAGHYVPQLASTILSRNKNTSQRVINLKGIAIGNAWIDDNICDKGMYDYFWTHGLNSDETNQAINKHCDYATGNFSDMCNKFQSQANEEVGELDIYNIYAAPCVPSASKSGSVHDFDPCSEDYISTYLNLPEVQKALHVKNATKWEACGGVGWTDSPSTVLPTIKELIASGLRVWIYSGDTDGRVPVTSSRYAITTMNLPVNAPWRPWYSNKQVGGYVVGYKGAVFTTIRGAGHMVPSYQPERALTLISSFLHGVLPQ